MRQEFDLLPAFAIGGSIPIPRPVPLGAVVAVAVLADIYRIAVGGMVTSSAHMIPLPAGPEFLLGNYTPGRYAWILRDVRRLKTPVLFRGRQLFDVPDELLLEAV
jgi:hypothetical protein